jgi:DNA-binding response OmpR family regulator
MTDRASPIPLDSLRLATKLLYVEDDDDLREMVAETLVDAGFEVTAVSSAETALAELLAAHFDVIVTDYNLTGENGAWLLSNAASKGCLEQTAALVLTSERAPLGVDGFTVLRKPLAFSCLLAIIEEAVGQILPTAVVTLGAPVPTELDLVLDVTSTSPESQTAIRNVHRALKPFDKSRFRLTIVDVAKGGAEEWYQKLEADRVIVTPTLVRKKPGPQTWIVGTVAPSDAVDEMVASVLGERSLQ